MTDRIQALRLADFGLEVQGRTLLAHVDLELPARGLTAVFGASGTGKTTLLRALAWLAPHLGSLTAEPQDSLKLSPEEYRRQVQYVHQEPRLFPGSVEENLALPGTLRHNRGRVEPAAAWPAHLAALGLGTTILDQETDNLSGGEKQRLALVRALTLAPAFLLLDEPTSAMDVATESATLEHLRALSQGCGVIMVTHSVELISGSDRVLLLGDGTLTEVSDPLDRAAVRRLVTQGQEE